MALHKPTGNSMVNTHYIPVVLPQNYAGNILDLSTELQLLVDSRELKSNYLSDDFSSISALTRKSACSTKTLQEAMNSMVIERKARKEWKANTACKYASQLQQIVSFIGADRAVSSLCEEDVRNVREALSTKAKNTKELTGFADRYNEEVIGPETSERYFNMLKRFLDYCEELGYLTRCLHRGNGPTPVPAGEAKYKTFTHLEMRDIFLSRVFTTEPDAKIRWTPYSYCFWVPLLAAFTGARPGEICQLLVGDIYEMDGVLIVNITDEGP